MVDPSNDPGSFTAATGYFSTAAFSMLKLKRKNPMALYAVRYEVFVSSHF